MALGRAAAYAYGACTLAVAYLSALSDPKYWRKQTRDEAEQLRRGKTNTLDFLSY